MKVDLSQKHLNAQNADTSIMESLNNHKKT